MNRQVNEREREREILWLKFEVWPWPLLYKQPAVN